MYLGYQNGKITFIADTKEELENIIKEARLVENVHNLIKNNNKNFEINEVELEAANVLA